jgi:arsenate reductase
MAAKRRVLVLCTGNSCRSQMAEGWINHDLGSMWQARSAGTRPADRVHPFAVAVMAEAGVDISGGRPKSVETLLDETWDLVVTVCDSARESCPVFPRPVEQIHVSFPDPAEATGTDDEVMAVFRAVRDDIRKRLVEEVRIRTLSTTLKLSQGSPSDPPMESVVMDTTPFVVRVELEGWELFWALLETGGDRSGLAALRGRVAGSVRARFSETSRITEFPPIAALRVLFRAVGCDPTRYRPSSEALLRRLVKGAELPAIHPLVDLNNCLSAELGVPCCVMREGSFGSDLVFRAGVAGESYQSLRGPFSLEAKPLLVDEIGPVDAPITGSERVMVEPTTERAWLVAYLPRGVVEADSVWASLESLAPGAGVEARRFASSV